MQVINILLLFFTLEYDELPGGRDDSFWDSDFFLVFPVQGNQLMFLSNYFWLSSFSFFLQSFLTKRENPRTGGKLKTEGPVLTCKKGYTFSRLYIRSFPGNASTLFGL